MGYTLFLFNFYIEWKNLLHESHMEQLGPVDYNSLSDYDCLDSTSPISNTDVISHAANRWNNLRIQIQHR